MPSGAGLDWGRAPRLRRSRNRGVVEPLRWSGPRSGRIPLTCILGREGYPVHFSETCDPEDVHLITHVETTPATVHEAMRSGAIQRALYERNLPPAEHLVDAAYVTADVLVHVRQEYGIAVIGPPRPKPSWHWIMFPA